MIYKAILFILFTSLFITSAKAQELCDSTYIVCDSITIDSIVFTDFPATGDRVHFIISSNHNFLHGPIFTICPVNEEIEFSNNDFLFSGIVGPITVNTFYEFLNFNSVGDTLEGHIVINNFNNSFPNCIIHFKVLAFNDISNIDFNSVKTEVDIFPNPAYTFITIDLNNNNLTGKGIQLFDLMGRNLTIDNRSTFIDLNHVPTGVYILSLEINESMIISKKIIVSK